MPREQCGVVAPFPCRAAPVARFAARLLTAFYRCSYVEGIAETLTSNFTVLMAGFSLIIFYFSFAMGKFNVIEQRVSRALVGERHIERTN